MTAPGSLERLPVVIAAACVLADVTELVLDAPAGPHIWVVLVLWAAADLALATPPRFTTAVVAAHAVLMPVTTLLLVAGGAPAPVVPAGFLVAGYRAGAWLRSRPAAVALGALLGGVLAAEVLAAAWSTGRSGDPPPVLLIAVYLLTSGVIPWLVGRYTTSFRDHLAELRHREERRVTDELAAVERALAHDRGAIARDLHDVLAHHVSAITVHAGAARLGLPAEGADAARRSVAAVEAAGRAATVDLRRLLDLLHGADPADRQPGIDNLDELVDGVRSAGLDARLDTAGPVTAIPESVGVVVYRVVQEALTNALRHGTRGPTRVGVRHDGTVLTVVVTNPVAGPTGPAGTGRGLPGMRTRVGLFGGSLSAGPTGDGREWEVRVELPVEGP